MGFMKLLWSLTIFAVLISGLKGQEIGDPDYEPTFEPLTPPSSYKGRMKFIQCAGLNQLLELLTR